MAANVQSYNSQFHFLYCSTTNFNLPRFPFTRNPNVNAPYSVKFRLSIPNTRYRNRLYPLVYATKSDSDIETVVLPEEIERPPFDINRAVILAGFAFEAYTTPTENTGKSEVDAAGCQTVILSESFLREIYDGQVFIKLKKGYDFPAMDPWGTSDPYVVLQLDSQIVKSNIKWGTKEPTWNEDLTLYIKNPPTINLQVAAWDANLVTPHKRMGNSIVNLESFCDGNSHEVLVELEGMGGGGKVQLQIKYKSFETIEEEKNWWRIPFVAEFLRNNDFESTLRKVIGSEPVQARQFVQYAFSQLKSINLNTTDVNSLEQSKTNQKDSRSDKDSLEQSKTNQKDSLSDKDSLEQSKTNQKDSLSDKDSLEQSKTNQKDSLSDKDFLEESKTSRKDSQSDKDFLEESKSNKKDSQSDKDFWKNFSDNINENVVKQLGLTPPEKIKWEGFDLLSKIGIQSQSVAEEGYIEAGLAIPNSQDSINDKNNKKTDKLSTLTTIQSSFPDIKKATQDLLRQTDSILGALMVLNATVTELSKDGRLLGKTDSDSDANSDSDSGSKPVLDERKAEEMRALFSTAESAMEAWAMLATSLGHTSFIKSEFEKICFLDNPVTDTQVAIWRDLARKRLVVAFRGTEQVRWKDLRTDLMMIPAGLNPERIGGDFKEEIQVHSGFLTAYDSVRTRIISLIKTAIQYQDDGDDDDVSKWHVYVTGHSLGGALATLLALELSSSQLSKRGAISVTMYNFGSPRVGNKKFAQLYNQKVKDSWRVVNHRDIIPSVPRLMGYCHVAQPIYLAAGDVENAMENMELLGDGYEGDVIGESTPDVLVSEFMKGEKELIEKILNTEINIFRSIRDGTALMQHMEDFYYVSLLENVRLNYRTNTKSVDGSSSSVKEV